MCSSQSSRFPPTSSGEGITWAHFCPHGIPQWPCSAGSCANCRVVGRLPFSVFPNQHFQSARTANQEAAEAQQFNCEGNSHYAAHFGTSSSAPSMVGGVVRSPESRGLHHPPRTIGGEVSVSSSGLWTIIIASTAISEVIKSPPTTQS